MTAHDLLLERLVRVGKVAGQDALARVAYQMARRCWSMAAETKTRNIRWFEDPKPISALYSDLLVLEARVGLTLAKDELPLADPSSESALACAHACLDLGVGVEGESPRLQFLRAQCVRADGGIEESAERFEILLDQALSPSWYQVAQEERQTVLLLLAQYEQTAQVGNTLLTSGKSLPLAAFNRLTAQAWMEMGSEFRESAARLRAALEGVDDSAYLSRLIVDEAPWLATQFGLDLSEVVQHLSLPGPSPSSQRPSS